MSFLTTWGSRNRRNAPATFNGVNDAMSQFDRAFENIFNDGFYVQPSRQKMVGPQSYIVTDDKEHRISIALPGVPKNAVEVTVAGGTLTVGYQADDGDGTAITFATSFNKSWTLPDGVDTKNIAASSTDGVLTISVPRIEAKADTGRTISVE